MTFNIWAPYFTRSEYGPLRPLIKELNSRKEVYVFMADLKGREWRVDPDMDLVLAGFDRPEMVQVAYRAYHQNIPVAQIFAGDIAGGAYDDADRFAISEYASLLFCSTDEAFDRVWKAIKHRLLFGEDPRIWCVGATHHDNMEVREPEHPIKEPFDLVLYNPPSLASSCVIMKELNEIIGAAASVMAWFAPNGDKNSALVETYAKPFRDCLNINTFGKRVHWLDSLPRPEFLWYLANCERIIGNSSCMFYEAPYFDKPTVQVGMRNRFREKMPKSKCVPGASKIIADKIIEYLKEKQ